MLFRENYLRWNLGNYYQKYIEQISPLSKLFWAEEILQPKITINKYVVNFLSKDNFIVLVFLQ